VVIEVRVSLIPAAVGLDRLRGVMGAAAAWLAAPASEVPMSLFFSR